MTWRVLRTSGLVMMLVIVLAVAVAAVVALLPTHTRPIPATLRPDPTLVERGRYVAATADCAACHSKPGDAPFAGGLAIQSPIGAIYSTNISPDPETGLGAWTLDDFDRAVRHGVNRRNTTLYPAMPYPSYVLMTDEDVVALYSYLKYAVKPVRMHTPDNAIRWPLSMRWPLALWRRMFAPAADAAAFDASRYADPVVARGAYLVQGPGHCGGCHTPRAITLQERALDESRAEYLSGGPIIDGWVAVNLRGNPADGLGQWTMDDIVDTLRSGHNTRRAVIGSPMGDAIVHGTQYLTDADLRAVATYLKILPATGNGQSTFTVDPSTARALTAGQEADRGAQLYLDNCSACHRTNGAGATGAFPAIAGNSSVLSADPTSIVRLILGGSARPATKAAPSALGMPGFGWRLSDQETGELATFVRQNWGNHAPAVSAEQVREVRRELAELR